MKALRHLVLVTSVAMLAACASTTPYQPASKPGGFDGYSQTMLDNRSARITFGGNSLTDRETVENYMIYRAAEMAVERGFDHFSLTNRDTQEKTRVDASPSYGHGFGPYDPYFRYSFFRPRIGWSPFDRYSYYGRRQFSRSRGFGFMGYANDPFYNDINVRETTRYRTSAEVVFGHGRAAGADTSFNAREVLQNLGPSIVYPDR